MSMTDSFNLLREVTSEIFAQIKHRNSMQNQAVLFLGLQQNHMYTKTINSVLAFIQSHSVRTGPTPTSGFLYFRY